MKFDDLVKANSTLKPTDVKGKNYIEVAERIKAFRMLHPDGCIHTEMLSNENGVCVFKATVCDEDGRMLGTGTAFEKQGDSFINTTSYIENCETSAVGRALGMLGIGIEMGLSSLEEVTNKMAQPEVVLTTTEKERLAHIQNEIKRIGKDESVITSAYGVNSLEELVINDEYYKHVVNRLAKTESK